MPIAKDVQIIDLNDLIKSYVNTIQPNEGMSLVDSDWLVDPVKGKVILTLTIEVPSTPAKAPPKKQAGKKRPAKAK